MWHPTILQASTLFPMTAETLVCQEKSGWPECDTAMWRRRHYTITGEAGILSLAHQPLHRAHLTSRLLLQTEPEVLPLLSTMPTLCANKKPCCRMLHTFRYPLLFSSLRSVLNTLKKTFLSRVGSFSFWMPGFLCGEGYAISPHPSLTAPAFPGYSERKGASIY